MSHECYLKAAFRNLREVEAALCPTDGKGTKRLGAPRSAVNWFRRETKSTERPVNRRSIKSAERILVGGAGGGQSPTSEGVQFVTMVCTSGLLPSIQKGFISKNSNVFYLRSILNSRNSTLSFFQLGALSFEVSLPKLDS